MKKRGWVVGLIAVLAVAGGAGWMFWQQRAVDPKAGVPAAVASASKGKEGSGKDDKPAVPLEFQPSEVTQPVRAKLDQVINFSGPLVAPRQAQLRAKAAGRLLNLRVDEGDRVKAGQPLGVQDLADLNSRVTERMAMVDSAKAALDQAERVHAQNERLFTQGFLSAAALDTSRAALHTAKAQVEAAVASLNTTRVAVRDGSIVAPISGIVAKRLALPGEMLSAEQPLLNIVDLSQLELAAMVATHEVSRLSVGLKVQLSVEGHDAPVDGRIARIAPAAEPGSRAIGVTIALANPGERFRAGQYAVASVTLPDTEARLVLPTSAVGSTAGQHHVWTLAEGKLIRRTVVLGRKDEAGGRVEIRDGLPADATVIAARFDNLREGAAALVVPAAATAAASSPTAR
jgi:membrane fusion protein, multidrug efflux system